jgi:DNA repair protein RecN (Recombination protein N)
MLLELNIRNIALIEKLRVEFGQGLNVLTGETGAGKSIVVDSVNLALGERADRELIRTGAEKASVQAVFDVSDNPKVLRLLDEFGLSDEDGLLVISRELSSSGRNICRISGAVTPLSQLKQITALLVDVHGQHQHQSLMIPARHLHFLDCYGDEQHMQKMETVRKLYGEYAEIRKRLDQFTGDKMERERRIDMLRFQLEEIEAVRVKPGEDEKLEQQNRLLSNAEKIASSVETAYALVYLGGNRSPSAQEALRRASSAMGSIAPLDERFEGLQKRLEELYYSTQDVGYELQDVKDGLEYDPAQADRVADRLDALNRLKRKYGPELSDVIAFREDVREQLSLIEEGDEQLEQLKKRCNQARDALNAASQALSESRRALACGFVEKMLGQLSELGMERVRFQVRFQTPPDLESAFSPHGVDNVEFMISPNPGEPVKPLAHVASGGELSRVMLALKAIAADHDDVHCMIFDEIDTGISGRMAQVVGEKMAAIALDRQVICVTHLPQIAALGDQHFVVEKQTDGQRTDSSVRRLDDEGRIKELARMVGGADDGDSSLAHARNMLTSARRVVEDLRAAQLQ